MKNKEIAVHAAQNVIPLHLNAEFYFERGMQSLDRYHYDKALRYFRRAVETEPDNAVHHINLAGVLSETGDYESSNEILQYIMESLDANLTECHFYMANNYLNLDLLEESERSLLNYLELDEQGLYIDEAEEMLELLAMELGRPVKVRSIRSREALFEHDQARLLLEEGRFHEAVRTLEKLSDRHPEFLAARNNLALAYYYMGQLDQAVLTVQSVLEEEPGNLHALCNLTILKLQLEQYDEVEALSSVLKKLMPINPEHGFKLATTMGILGEHEQAYTLFRRLLRSGTLEPEASLFHYTAVAAAHTGRYEEARKLWRQVKKLDPETNVADYYLDRIDDLERYDEQEQLDEQQQLDKQEKLGRQEQTDDIDHTNALGWTEGLDQTVDNDDSERSDRKDTLDADMSKVKGEDGRYAHTPVAISYNYHLPFEEQFKWFEATDGSMSEQFRRDPIVRSSFFWVLRYGDHDTKLQVIQALGLIGDREVESALREFIRRPEEADDLKKAAILVLNALGAEGPYEAVIDGRNVEMNGCMQGFSLPAWEQSWQEVLRIAQQKMEKRYDVIERCDLQTLWTDFLNRTYPETPTIRRPEGWSAALEYLIAKMHRRQVTYLDVAARYGISASTVRRHVAEIDEACGLREKMEAIFRRFGGKL